MTVLFVGAFVAGLLLGVRIMLVGVERQREIGETGTRSFRRSPSVFATFAIMFGVAGYVLERAHVSALSAFVAALALAVVASQITARLVNRWWAVTPEHEHEDERYELQGHLARVTATIDRGAEGEVTFDVGPTHRVVRARNIDEGPVESGTDVVIERIEDDIAYVEAWAQVEKRIS